MADRLDLHVLDESGFAPTLPTTYTWARMKARARVPYEAPQRRRVNVLGAWAPLGSRPRFAYTSRAGKLDSAAFLEFVWQRRGRDDHAAGRGPGRLPAGAALRDRAGQLLGPSQPGGHGRPARPGGGRASNSSTCRRTARS